MQQQHEPTHGRQGVGEGGRIPRAAISSRGGRRGGAAEAVAAVAAVGVDRHLEIAALLAVGIVQLNLGAVCEGLPSLAVHLALIEIPAGNRNGSIIRGDMRGRAVGWMPGSDGVAPFVSITIRFAQDAPPVVPVILEPTLVAPAT